MAKKGIDRKALEGRIKFLIFALPVLFSLAIIARLFYMQVIDYEFYESYALDQQLREQTVSPTRGTIYDRNMKELAVSATTSMVTIDPNLISTKDGMAEKVATALSEILGIDYDSVYENTQKSTSYVVIQRDVEKEISDLITLRIVEDGLTGVSLPSDSTRYYPYENFASHILGFVGTDEQGLLGLELYYDATLSGTSGRIVTTKNAAGTEMPFSYEQYIPAQDGNSIVLTIDETIQHYLEKQLETALEENGAANGVAGIVMNVKTGEILAIASKPDFDLNDPFTITDSLLLSTYQELEGTERSVAYTAALNQMWRDKPVQDSYEPGSTFKIFTAAVALEEVDGIIDNHYYCPGYYETNGLTISCWKTTGHGDQTFVEALQNSCNPAMMMISEEIGLENFYEYYKAFGLDSKTGIDLPGEASSIFYSEDDFKPIDLAIASFGQGFQVTPIQMITMVSAVVNDGILVEPHIVKEIIDSDGLVVQSFDTVELGQVISSQTSEIMREALESVVSVGTGKKAYIAGYSVGGKTATSEKIPRGEDKYIASFIAVAPMTDPEIAILIMIDEPTGESNSGGQIAAPVARKVLEETLPYLGIEPSYSEDEMSNIDVIVPSIIGKSKYDAESTLSNSKIAYKFIGDGDTVTAQIPSAYSKIPITAEVIVYLGEENPETTTVMPDLSGMTVNQATNALNAVGLYLRVNGINISIAGDTAKATTQSVTAGEVVDMGTTITVEFVDNTNIGE